MNGGEVSGNIDTCTAENAENRTIGGGAFYVLGKRYISFKNKFNILTITYCIDYFENKTKKKIQNK